MKNFHLYLILVIAVILRSYYLMTNAGDLSFPNLGGDPCHHYNIAYNISKGLGPTTSFIFSYWFEHHNIPALTDVYPPGFHYFASFFLLINDSYNSGRFANFLISIITILLIYFTGKKIHSQKLGLIAAFIISLNYFHIENSTVFMTVNFYTFLVTIFFYVLLTFSDENNKHLKHLILGLIIGYSSISFGAWQILFIIYFYNYFFKENKFKIKNFYLTFLIGFSIFFIPWAYKTYIYFDFINYSNQKYYPYWKWGDMMNSNIRPQFSIFWQNLDILEFLQNHIVWSVKNITKFCLALFPTFIFYLSFLLIPICIFGYYINRDKNLFSLILFIILYFIAMSLASYSNGGVMYFRHFMPYLPSISLLLASGIIGVYNLKIFSKLRNYNKILISLVYISSFIGTIIGFEIKETFWQRDAKPFYEFSKKIKLQVKEDERIMYGLTVADAWCSTKREIVQDPTFLQTKNSKRAAEEIKKYKVKYLFIDISDKIYDRTQHNIKETLKFYNDIDLSEIEADEKNGFYLYKINNVK